MKPKDIDTSIIIVEGMTCNHCKANVEKALQSIHNIYNVHADIATGEVAIDGEINIEKIKTVLDDIGYEFKGIKKEYLETKKLVNHD